MDPSNKLWMESTQSKTPASHFEVFEFLLYSSKAHNELVDLLEIDKEDPTCPMYIIRYFCQKKISVKHFLNTGTLRI